MNNEKFYTVGIGGAAGDGIREAGLHLAMMLHQLGYYTFLSFDHPSLIRGGHNYSRISFSKEKVWCDHTKLDVLIAVNSETVKLHEKELSDNGVIVVEESYLDETKEVAAKTIPVPFSVLTEEQKAVPIARTSVALGIFSFITGIPFEKMRELVQKSFEESKVEMNLGLAENGFRYAEEKAVAKWTEGLSLGERNDATEIVDGNEAVGKGLLASKLNFFIAYPMTPASSVLHFLAKEAVAREDLKTIQPEDEIGAINMAIGVAYSGKRTAIGTATGGFALMQEAFSFAGMSETPLVAVVSQRPGPATGVPTGTSQGDLKFLVNSGHGEFPRLVIAPGDAEEAYYTGALALDLSWKYQIPSIVLLDKQLSESAQTVLFEPNKIAHEEAKSWNDDGKPYARYRDTEDGVSPLAFPGTPNAVVKLTSYEHDEEGISTETPELVTKMIDKRFKKRDILMKEVSKYETMKIYGDTSADILVIFWGSTKGAVLEAAKYLTKPVKLIQVLWMEPFDTARIKNELQSARMIVDIEGNHDAQLVSLLREKNNISPTHTILQYNSKPFDPVELAAKINALIA